MVIFLMPQIMLILIRVQNSIIKFILQQYFTVKSYKGTFLIA